MKPRRISDSLLGLFYFIGSFPFRVKNHFHASNDYTVLPPGKVQKQVWKISAVVITAYVINTNVTLMFFAERYLEGGDVVKLVFHAIYSLSFPMGVIVHFILFVHGDKLKSLVNGTIQLGVELERTLKSDLFRKGRQMRVNLVMLLCCGICVGCNTLAIPAFIYFRAEVWSFGNNIYRVTMPIINIDYFSMVLGCVSEMWFVCNLAGNLALHFYTQLLCIQTFSGTLGFLQSPGLSQKQFPLSVRVFVYSKLRIILKEYNSIYRALFYPSFKCGFGLLTIQAILVAVKLGDLKGIMLYGLGVAVVGGIGLSVVVTFAAIIYDSSLNFRSHLKKQLAFCPGVVYRQLVRSYKVEGITCGEFYNIQKVTSLTVLGIVTNIAGSVLISVSV